MSEPAPKDETVVVPVRRAPDPFSPPESAEVPGGQRRPLVRPRVARQAAAMTAPDDGPKTTRLRILRRRRNDPFGSYRVDEIECDDTVAAQHWDDSHWRPIW